MKNNMLIRIKLMEKDIRQWEFGKMLGVSESTICRFLREELDEETQKMVCEFLDGNKNSSYLYSIVLAINRIDRKSKCPPTDSQRPTQIE